MDWFIYSPWIDKRKGRYRYPVTPCHNGTSRTRNQTEDLALFGRLPAIDEEDLKPWAESLLCEAVSGWTLATVRLDTPTDLIEPISSMAIKMIRAVNYFPGYCQKPIK